MSFAGIDEGNSNLKIAIFDSQGNPIMLTNDRGELSHSQRRVLRERHCVVRRGCRKRRSAGPVPVRDELETLHGDRHRTVHPAGRFGVPGLGRGRAPAHLRIGPVPAAYRRCAVQGRPSVCRQNYNGCPETGHAGRGPGRWHPGGGHPRTNPRPPVSETRYRSEATVSWVLMDLGGGTFDVSIVRVYRDMVEVIATNGEPKLGGQDFNAALRDLVLDRFRSQARIAAHTGGPIPWCSRTCTAAWNRPSWTLTARESAQVVLSVDGTVFPTTVTRDEFRTATQDLVARAMECAHRTFEEAGVRPEDLREVIPVGGASQMPCFLEAIEQRFGRKPTTHCEPNYAVAMGTLVIGRITEETRGAERGRGWPETPPAGRPGAGRDRTCRGRLHAERFSGPGQHGHPGKGKAHTLGPRRRFRAGRARSDRCVDPVAPGGRTVCPATNARRSAISS